MEHLGFEKRAIDWSREPENERAAKIRARWLQRRLSNEFGWTELHLTALTYRSLASDIARAVATARSLSAHKRMRSEADEIKDIVAELKEEGAG